MAADLQAHVLNPLTPEQIKAILIRSAWLNRETIDIKCLAEDLKKALECGLDAGEIDLTAIPEGYYSQNIDEYTSLLVVLGYATRRSPLSLTKRGHQLLKDMVNQAYKIDAKSVKRWADALGTDMGKLLTASAN